MNHNCEMQKHNCDTEPTYLGMVVPKSCAKYTTLSASLFLFSAIYAAWKRHYDLSAAALMIFASSMLYWSHPVYDWRRNLDIAVALLASAYFLKKAFETKMRNTWLIIFLAIIMFYSFARYLNSIGMTHYSVMSHCVMHIVANCGIVLYCL